VARLTLAEHYGKTYDRTEAEELRSVFPSKIEWPDWGMPLAHPRRVQRNIMRYSCHSS
jgi:hypothetical protein